MTGPILLDTCALIFLTNRAPLTNAAQAALADVDMAGEGLAASPISAWEVGQLVARNRLVLPAPPREWFEGVLAAGVELAAMPPEVLIASSFLPDSPLRDPADKIMAATARAYGYRLMTRDRPLLDYAATGAFRAIAC